MTKEKFMNYSLILAAEQQGVHYETYNYKIRKKVKKFKDDFEFIEDFKRGYKIETYESEQTTKEG